MTRLIEGLKFSGRANALYGESHVVKLKHPWVGLALPFWNSAKLPPVRAVLNFPLEVERVVLQTGLVPNPSSWVLL